MGWIWLLTYGNNNLVSNLYSIIDTDIDFNRLLKDMNYFLESNQLTHYEQVSLTSVSGENDWTCSVGSMSTLKEPEESYCTINKALVGTYIADLINKYSSYYRWRLLKLNPKQTYSVHCDAFCGYENFRVHIPVITNSDSYFCFYDNKPTHNISCIVRHIHFKAGRSYKVNTTGFHSAVNYGKTIRYHMVGVFNSKLL